MFTGIPIGTHQSQSSTISSGCRDRFKPGKHLDLVNLDLLITNVRYLRQLLAYGEVQSFDLVKKYLDQINKHDQKKTRLNIVFSTAHKEVVPQ